MSNLTDLQDIKIKLRKEYDQLQLDRANVVKEKEQYQQLCIDLRRDEASVIAAIDIAVKEQLQAERKTTLWLNNKEIETLRNNATKEIQLLRSNAHKEIQGKYDEAEQRIKDSFEIQKEAKIKNDALVIENNRMIGAINKLEADYKICNELVDMADKLKISISSVSMATFLKSQSLLSPEQKSLYFNARAPK